MEPIARALDFLRRHPRAVMSTLRTDGRPALSPVLAAVDDEERVVISTREAAYKVRHLRRDPRVALCIVTERFFGSWYQVEGEAEIVSWPEAMEPLVDYYRRISGEHDDWSAYREAMRDEQRVLLRFTVTRAGPIVSG